VADSATIKAAPRLRTSSDFLPRTPSALLLRLRARLRRPWLDREIVRGADRPGDRALALREGQLTRRRERRRLASRLEQVLADRPSQPRLSSAVPIDHRAVRVAKPILTELILSLRSIDPVEPRGVVLAWRLLTDASSPIYAPPGGRPGNPDGLWYESLGVLFALRPLPTVRPTAGAGR